MEKLRELMKEHQDKTDKKVLVEVLELLKKEPGLFVVTVKVTNNFFLGAENGKAAAFLYTSREYAEEFVNGLELVGVETKILEIRPLQRIAFFNDLYRSGFEAVSIDKGQEYHMSMSLFSIIEKPKDTSEIVMNPSLMRTANQFYQALVQHQAFPQMQDLMCKELYGARLLVPVADPKMTKAVPVLKNGKGVRFYPVFTDLVEFGKFDRKHQFAAKEIKFRDMKKYLDYVDGIVVNPFGFALRLDADKLDRIEKENMKLKVVK